MSESPNNPDRIIAWIVLSIIVFLILTAIAGAIVSELTHGNIT